MKVKYLIKTYRRFDPATGLYIPYLKTWFEEDENGKLIYKQKML